ncbi:MAG: four helix bundle protein [Candidatus Colwellbacteria bacterium RIFCSPLOWO2_01_FULL_48_10]|uniref:Four helix bundle protein n=2 Tax=Bacteria candidate phyla TaxID=1783234 RepID=A0A1F5P3Y6_9BACT|nr:MAG: four helix bundle protein [Candidatus Doudnabacteria bacterium RIFCSPHIGHO2_01_FULL_49_9]OGY60023.1 MAG: four helix bundle protein [Candidatus Colwellbacteria bacterium RIFCSPLOWO2_01_FULL_48_10]
MESYKNLKVWEKSVELVVLIYGLTGKFPKEELYGLVSQIRRAAISIPSNVAEGSRRGSRKDFRHFLLNAFGSGSELETQIIIAKKLSFGEFPDFVRIDAALDEVMRMLNGLIKKLEGK